MSEEKVKSVKDSYVASPAMEPQNKAVVSAKGGSNPSLMLFVLMIFIIIPSICGGCCCYIPGALIPVIFFVLYKNDRAVKNNAVIALGMLIVFAITLIIISLVSTIIFKQNATDISSEIQRAVQEGGTANIVALWSQVMSKILIYSGIQYLVITIDALVFAAIFAFLAFKSYKNPDYCILKIFQ